MHANLERETTMKKRISAVLIISIIFLIILSSCGSGSESQPATPAIAFISPTNGQTVSLDNLTLEVTPVTNAEGYAWDFLQYGAILWDSFESNQELTGPRYEFPRDNNVIQRAVPGEMKIQVRAHINGTWNKVAEIMVIVTAPESRSVPTQAAASATPVVSSQDANQTILFAGDGILYALNPNTKIVTTLMQGLEPQLHSIVFDTNRKYIYIDAEYNLWRAPFAQIGSQQPALEYLDMPQMDINQGLDIDLATGQIFLGQYYSGVFTRNINDNSWVQIVSPQDISPLLGQRGQLQIDPVNRQVYFRTAFNGDCDACRWIYRADYDGRNLSKIVQANGGDALALDLEGSKLYFTDLPGNCTLKRANLDGTQAENLPTIPNNFSYHCWNLAIDNTAGKLYLLMGDQDYSGVMTIARMNLDGSSFEQLFETKNNYDGLGALKIVPTSLEQITSGLSISLGATAIPTPPLAPTPTKQSCAGSWSRLQIGDEAIVLPGDPNLLRSEPKKGDNIIGKLYAGDRFSIVGGPECADGVIFWLVSSPSITSGYGWTAEGDGKEYWLEPVK